MYPAKDLNMLYVTYNMSHTSFLEMDENKEETNEQSPGTEYCIICSCGFNRDEYDTLDPMGQICIARCCGFTFHRTCVSRYGYNFGLVKVKCPNCNGKLIIL